VVDKTGSYTHTERSGMLCPVFHLCLLKLLLIELVLCWAERRARHKLAGYDTRTLG
jgi:hypothetical protein